MPSLYPCDLCHPWILFAGVVFAGTSTIVAADDTARSTVVLTSGETFEARLDSIDSDWRFVFDEGDKTRAVGAGELVRWGSYRDRPRGTRVLLTGSGVLIADLLEITADTVLVESQLFGEVALPLRQVRGLVFETKADPLAQDKLEFAVADAVGRGDQVLFRNGDRTSGIIARAELTVGPAAERRQPIRSIRIATRAGEAETPLTDVAAIVFSPLLAEAPIAQRNSARVGFADGTLVTATRIEWNDGIVRLTLASGVRVVTDDATLLEELTYVRPTNVGVSYLSDLATAGYRHIPFLAIERPYLKDRSVNGGRLRLRDEVIEKGIGMTSTSRLAYTLAAKYDAFAARIAIDATAGRQGSAIFRVYVDRDGWKVAYASQVVHGGDAPREVTVNVSGANRLALIVEFAEQGDTCDYANWLEARLLSK